MRSLVGLAVLGVVCASCASPSTAPVASVPAATVTVSAAPVPVPAVTVTATPQTAQVGTHLHIPDGCGDVRQLIGMVRSMRQPPQGTPDLGEVDLWSAAYAFDHPQRVSVPVARELAKLAVAERDVARVWHGSGVDPDLWFAAWREFDQAAARVDC